MRRSFTAVLALGLLGMAGCYHLAGVCDCEPQRCNCPPWVNAAGGGTPALLPTPVPKPAEAPNPDK